MSISYRPENGEIADEGIRYMLLRPDVLMGLAKELPGITAGQFLGALRKVACRNVQSSFAQYRRDGRFSGSDVLDSTCRIAASLGWGSWLVTSEQDGTVIVRVRNSPFAAGFGPSQGPVCAPIAGVLQAVAQVSQVAAAEIEEISCAAQGASECRFRYGRACAAAKTPPR
jgi:uncharacterized protein